MNYGQENAILMLASELLDVVNMTRYSKGNHSPKAIYHAALEKLVMDISSKVLAYETFLNETLKEDLKKVLDNRDNIYNQIAEYLQLKNVIERIQESKLDKEELKTKVDLGCNFYVQARVPDATRIYVCIGYGFYVEFKLDEALKFIKKKTARLNETADELTKDSTKIKAHIKLVLEGLREIQNIEDVQTAPQRDLWS